MNGTLNYFLLMLLAAGTANFARAQPAFSVGNLPLWFEASPSPAGSDAAFVAHTRGAEFSISPRGASFALRNGAGEFAQVQMQFVGANSHPTIRAEGELAAKVNYLIGDQPSQWHSDLATFARVKVDNIYPGVNVVYYGNQRELEYDLNLAAGVNPQTIAIRFDGAEGLSVDPQGQLVVRVAEGTVYQHRPEIYQVRNGLRVALTGGYRIVDGRTVAFNVGKYDPRLPLVIDPVLGYATFFGGNSGELLNGMTVDAAGNVYIAGSTVSTVFSNAIPTTAVHTNFQGGTITGDAFIAKFDSSGILKFLTLLGGSADDGASALALDAQGNIVAVGFTDSANFPTTNLVGGLTNKLSGTTVPGLKGVYFTDAFVARLSADGSTLLNSGYLGGNESEAAQTLALDPNTGNLFLAGYTYSTNYPTTPGAYQPTLHCTNSFYYNFNGFISVISFTNPFYASKLVYSTFLGGTNADVIRGIAITNNILFVTGYTASTNEYGTNFLSQNIVYKYVMGATNVAVTNQTQPAIMNGTNAWNGILWSNTVSPDAFVAAFTIGAGDTNLTLLYSGYIGGSGRDYAYAIAVDGATNAYIVGSTLSTNFPYVVPNPNAVTNLSFATTNGPLYIPATNAFLTQIKWSGTNASVGYSIVFGQQGIDTAYDLVLDTNGNIFVVGSVTSTNFPVTTNNIYGSLRATNDNWNSSHQFASDAFVACFRTTSALPVYSAYLGGSSDDFGYAIAEDPAGNVYVAGVTYSTNFPTFKAFDGYRSGSNDVFVAKILPTRPFPPLSLTRSHTNLDVSWQPAGEGGTTVFHLESTTNLTTTNWLTVSNLVISTNGVVNFAASPTNPAQFFRLHQY